MSKKTVKVGDSVEHSVFLEGDFQQLLRDLKQQGIDAKSLRPFPLDHPLRMGFDNFFKSVMLLTEFSITISPKVMSCAAAHADPAVLQVLMQQHPLDVIQKLNLILIAAKEKNTAVVEFLAESQLFGKDQLAEALVYLIKRSHFEVADKLIDQGALMVRAQDAFIASAVAGWSEGMQRIVASGADVRPVAAEAFQRAVVKRCVDAAMLIASLAMHDAVYQEQTLPMLAARYSTAEVMRRLVELKFNVFERNAQNDSLLHICIRDGTQKPEIKTELLMYLLTLDLLPFAIASGDSLIALALEAALPEFAQVLLEHNVPVPGVAGPLRESAVHLAAKIGATDILRVLIARGGDINKANFNGHTPLDLAFYTKNMPAHDLLAEHGAVRGRCAIHDVPYDVMCELFQHLSANDVMSIARVCKSWAAVAQDEDVWRVFGLRDAGLAPQAVAVSGSWRNAFLSQDNVRFSYHIRMATFARASFKYLNYEVFSTAIAGWFARHLNSPPDVLKRMSDRILHDCTGPHRSGMFTRGMRRAQHKQGKPLRKKWYMTDLNRKIGAAVKAGEDQLKARSVPDSTTFHDATDGILTFV